MRSIWFVVGSVALTAMAIGASPVVQQPAQGPARGGAAAVPAEYQFLYRIPLGSVRSAWAGIPYDSISLERNGFIATRYKLTLFRGTASGQGPETPDDRLGRAELHVDTPQPRAAGFGSFPDRKGDFVGTIDITTYGKLGYLFSNSQFSALRKNYGAFDDAATVTVAIATAGQTMSVTSDVRLIPIELWGIQQAIESIAKDISWTPK